MAGLTISITSDAEDHEFAAVNAMIAVLRGKNVIVLPDTDPNAGPASSSENGAGSPPSISATVPAAPVGMSDDEWNKAHDAAHIPHVPNAETIAAMQEARAMRPIPPAPPVPAAVVPPPPVSSGVVPVSPPAGVDVDAEGLPWDARIHGGTKEKTAKGVWKRRRNTDDAEWDRVRAELKQVMSAGASPTPIEALAARVPDAAAAFSVPNVPPPPPPAPVATVPPAPAATAAPDIRPAPAPAPDIGAFGALLKRIIEAQDAKQITVEQTNQAVQSMGLNTIGDLLNQPDLVAPVELVLFG